MFYISEYMKMLHTKQDSDTILTILQDIRNDSQQGIISRFIYLFFFLYIYYLANLYIPTWVPCVYQVTAILQLYRGENKLIFNEMI